MSWGSWTGWVSSTVNSVVEKSSQIIQDLTNDIEQEQNSEEKQNSSLKLYRTEEDIKKDSEEEKKQESQKPALKFYRTEEDIKKEEEEKKELDLEDQIIQKTTQVLSETTSFIGSLIQEGVQIISEGVDIEEVGRNTKELSQKFISQTAEAIGVVSGKAIDILNSNQEESARSEEKELEEPEPEQVEEKKEIPAPTFQYFFDEYMGNVHSQALELLSTESTMKVQDSQRKCPISQQIALSGFLQVITDIFTEDVDIDEPPPALDLNEKFHQLRDSMKNLDESLQTTTKQLISEFKENMQKVKEATITEEAKDSSESVNNADYMTFYNAQLNKIHLESLKIMAKYSAISVELVNRMVENWLVIAKTNHSDEISADSLHGPEQTTTKAKYLYYLTNIIADEISAVSTEFVSACRSISTIIQEVDSSNSDKAQESAKSLINTIYLDSGDAITNVHNAKDFAIPVLQWVYLLSESKLALNK